MTRLSLFLLLGVLITFSSAALAGHKMPRGGYDSHQGHHYDKHHNGHHGRHHNKHHNRHMRRHHRYYDHGRYYQPQALFSFSYGQHGPVIDYRSYPYNGYLYGNERRHGH